MLSIEFTLFHVLGFGSENLHYIDFNNSDLGFCRNNWNNDFNGIGKFNIPYNSFSIQYISYRRQNIA
jgi:hypothetical protein